MIQTAPGFYLAHIHGFRPCFWPAPAAESQIVWVCLDIFKSILGYPWMVSIHVYSIFSQTAGKEESNQGKRPEPPGRLSCLSQDLDTPVLGDCHQSIQL